MAEGLREERAALVHRYTVAGPESGTGLREVPAKDAAEAYRRSPRAATEYLIEVEPMRGFLWRWSLFELVELRGDGTQPPLPGRLPEPVATSGAPCWSRRAATRAAENAARARSAPQPEGVRPRTRPTPNRSPVPWRLIGPLVLLLLAAAVAAATIVEIRGDSRHATTAPLAPPATTRSVSRPNRHPISALRAFQLDAMGYSKMRSGHYAAALPLLERAVRRLRGTGLLNEAYSEFNLANTRYHLGRCHGVIALLVRSQRIQGRRVAIDNLRSDARRTCR